MISDIERQSKSPTISTLAALAEALEVPLTALVDIAARGAGSIHVERAAEHSSATDPASGATRDRIGPVSADSKVQILRYSLPPRCVAGPFPAHASGTLEHVHLAQGSIRVVLGTDAVTLEAGDSCTCRADRPHSFDNRTGDVAALIYLVIEPRSP
jgi:quercetin dioxygenase-like cupin family protein